MNYLLGKTGGGRNGEIWKILSDVNIFNLPEHMENEKVFEAGYKLEEDEWFVVENFSTQEFAIDLIREDFNSTDYAQLSWLPNSNLKFLCFYDSTTEDYFFQKVTPRHLIKTKILSLNTLQLVDSEVNLSFNKVPDAIYRRNSDKLFFRRLTSISSIFIGIDSLYRIATQQETEDFLSEDFIELTDGFEANKVKTANRKRIALAMETLGNMSTQDKGNILTYINDYCDGSVEYDQTNQFFKISSEQELKLVLFGIEEKFYTTHVGQIKRIANSVTAI